MFFEILGDSPRALYIIRVHEKILHNKRILKKKRSRLICQAIAVAMVDNKPCSDVVEVRRVELLSKMAKTSLSTKVVVFEFSVNFQNNKSH